MLKMSRKPSKKLAKLVLATLLFTGGAQLAISPSVAEASEVVTTLTWCEWNMSSQKWIFTPEGSMKGCAYDYAFIPADTNTTVLNLDGDWSVSQSIFGHEEGGSSDVSGYRVNLNGPKIDWSLGGAQAIGGGNATDNHVKVITGTVKITGEFLSLVGQKSIFRAFKSVKILQTQHQRFIAVSADIKVLIVHFYAEQSPADYRQNNDAQKDYEYDFLF